jgi:hypothetical protein
MRRAILVAATASLIATWMAGPAGAAPGDLLGTVTLPSNGDCSVAGTFTGSFYLTMEGGLDVNCAGSTLQVYEPPAGGNGAATLVATKSIVDADNNAVDISALEWDSSRALVWGAYNDAVWLIDVGDPTISDDALATFQFTPSVGEGGIVDGLAWDASDDTLYYSPDVECNVYQLSLPLGALLSTVTPKNENGQADCLVSGVAIGSSNTLYIGRDGEAEIRRVDKTTGDFVSEFATTSGRVEDLTCDPVSYAPNEAILAKDAYSALYEAFEVEAGTCPLPAPQIEVEIDIKPGSFPNAINVHSHGVIPVAILTTDTFDATTVDPLSVCFGDADDPAGNGDCTEAHGKGHIEDVDGDGDLDLVLHFDTQETGIESGDTEACLVGVTFDGQAIQGCDSIKTVGK